MIRTIRHLWPMCHITIPHKPFVKFFHNCHAGQFPWCQGCEKQLFECVCNTCKNDTSVSSTSSTHSYHWLKMISSSIAPLLNCSLLIDARIYLPHAHYSASFDTGHCILQLTQEYVFLYRPFPSTLFSLFWCWMSYSSIDARICLPLLSLSFHTAWPLSTLGIISFLYCLFPSTLFWRQASYARIYPLLSPLSTPGTISFNWHMIISSSIASFLPCSFDTGHHMQEYIFFYCLFRHWALYPQLMQEYIFLYHLFPFTLFWRWTLHARIYLFLLPFSFHALLTLRIAYKNISSSIASFDTSIISFNWPKNISFFYRPVPLLNILCGALPPFSAIAQHLYLHFSLIIHHWLAVQSLFSPHTTAACSTPRSTRSHPGSHSLALIPLACGADVNPYAYESLVGGHNRGSLLVDYLFFLTQTIQFFTTIFCKQRAKTGLDLVKTD